MDEIGIGGMSGRRRKVDEEETKKREQRERILYNGDNLFKVLI